MSDVLKLILIAVIAYLLGSISTGLILAKIKHGPNLREVGSGSTGATNVQRTMGTKNGLITFFGDFGKAALACGIGWWISGHGGALLAGLFVVIGHNWPVFFGFKGGKGVACSTAVALVCFPIPALISYVSAIAAIALTRFVSLGSMLCLVSYAVIVCLFWANTVPAVPAVWVILWAVLLAALCLIRHHANIGRLLQGKENKLSFKKKKD